MMQGVHRLTVAMAVYAIPAVSPAVNAVSVAGSILQLDFTIVVGIAGHVDLDVVLIVVIAVQRSISVCKLFTCLCYG